MKTLKKDIIRELHRIQQRDGGLLVPSRVVQEARNNKSSLHGCFEWNNVKAGEQYRIWQARMLIRVCIQQIEPESGQIDRIWVSLKSDRAEEDGGYRSLVSVLSDADLRAQLLQEAMEEMQYFEQKYQRLTELSSVFSAMQKVRKCRK